MEMIILIRKGVFTQQQQFMITSVLKLKGQLITSRGGGLEIFSVM
jgi:hypothetical protein